MVFIVTQPSQSIVILLGRLWWHLGARRQRQFGFLFVLMTLTSFAEVLSLGAILPFLSALTAPQRVFDSPLARPFIDAFEVTSPKQLLLALTIAFGVAVIFAGAMRLLLLWATTRLSYATGADLSINVYRRTLYQSYKTHLARNSSEIINGIFSKTASTISTITLVLSLMSCGVMLVAILAALLTIDPLIAMAAFSGFGAIYIVIIQLARRRLLLDSQIVARESTQVIKSLQEGLGGIRDVLLDGSQSAYCKIYSDADLPLRRAQGNGLFISQSPRHGVEALGMLLIAGLAYVLAQQEDGIAKAIPVLGALALGAQRLLPVLQQAYGAWAGIRSGQASLQDTLELLDQPLPDYASGAKPEPLPFDHQIRLRDLSFRYSEEAPWVLASVNLSIAKGSRVGFIGTTGTGKSTLLDIVMGLLEPSKGGLEVDGIPINAINQRAWQQHIAHVPQTIFLADSTIEENIAFGVPADQIDHERVRQAAKRAQISDAIDSWPKKYKTYVGERGARLSGGQRQRIGIARALYKQADVIIFDEATSALDNETEQAVIDAIDGLSKELTVLIIAHRLTTLKNCVQIVELDKGGINRIGGYQMLVD